MLNKKGQIGETVTWVIATVIIIVILVFFIFGASLLGETKDIKTFRESLFSDSSYQGDDLFLKKSLFAYFNTQRELNKRYIDRWLLEEESEKEFEFSVNETKKEIIGRLN
jgi:hypothetical protein